MGAIISEDADICTVSKILSAFYDDEYVLDIDDEEPDRKRGYFHGKCFDDAVNEIAMLKVHIQNNHDLEDKQKAFIQDLIKRKDHLTEENSQHLKEIADLKEKNDHLAERITLMENEGDDK